MRKFGLSGLLLVALFLVMVALSVYMVIESGNPDLPLWLTRLMRWVGFLCIAAYSYVAGVVVEDIKFGQYDE